MTAHRVLSCTKSVFPLLLLHLSGGQPKQMNRVSFEDEPGSPRASTAKLVAPSSSLNYGDSSCNETASRVTVIEVEQPREAKPETDEQPREDEAKPETESSTTQTDALAGLESKEVQAEPETALTECRETQVADGWAGETDGSVGVVFQC